MKKSRILQVLVLLISFIFSVSVSAGERQYRKLSVEQYIDKMQAGWVGKMAGVGWGAPTEFKFRGVIAPEANVPKWKPETVNQFNQDDLYVEMTFIRTLEQYGFDVSIKQAGIDFANSQYGVWHANKAGRDNLRKGIAPPDSGHPKFNKHADDIDYQIESDFSGLISPGMPNIVIELGEKFGHLMNYGDGVYSGQFVGGMYTEAFFETEPEKIIRAGLKCIPQGSQYYECISDVLKWHNENPDDWQKTWQLIETKYNKNPAYRRFSCNDPNPSLNIDAKINGAYVAMGLLYGKGDPDKTITIAMRCGLDSDCNPSTAGGVVFATIGFAKLPKRFKSALDPNEKFRYTAYNFPALIRVCEKLARQTVLRSGGRIEKDSKGQDVFVIPVEVPKPGKLEQSWQASQNGRTEVVELLLEKGAGVNVKSTTYGTTTLWIAAQEGNTEVVKLLLEKGADINAKDTDGVTAIILASQNGRTEVVKLLLEKGADVNVKSTFFGTTALWQASEGGHTEVVKLLLKKGAEVNAKTTGDSVTALWQASQNGHTEVVKLLLENGADVNVKLIDGRTALWQAAQNGHADIVKLLLENGADVDVKTTDGKWSALGIAKENGRTEVVQLLKKAGATE